MARQKNDGKGRIGGRAPGTPNKVTSELRVWVQQLVDKNRSKLEKDLKKMDARDRWAVMEKLMAYIIPKMSTTSTDVNMNLLGKLSEDDMNRIVEELLKNIDHETEN